jgi:hypothetical protein
MITVANTQPYFYYFIYFPTTKSGEGCGLNCDSMQIAEITYYYDENNTTTSVDATPSGGTIANPGTPGATAPGMEPQWPATSDITTGQTALRNAAKNRVSNVVLGNSLHLEQKIGSSANLVTIEQTGNYNKIAGFGGGTYAIIDGDNTGYPISTVVPSTTKEWFIEEARIRGGYNNLTVDFGVKAYIVDATNTAAIRSSALIYSGLFNSRTA